MFTVFTERETGAHPSEHDSPAADGDPGRSPAEQEPFGTELVSDDTEEFEEQQTGVFLTCDPTNSEISRSIRKTGLFRAADLVQAFLVAGITTIAAQFLKYLIKNGGSSWQWAALTVAYGAFMAAIIVTAFRNLNMEKNKYRENSMGKITIYPDRIELTESGKELPLDGTGEMLRTETAFTLVYPPEKESHNRALRFLIIPRRCVSGDLLPYVEAMLAAGTRPRIE